MEWLICRDDDDDDEIPLIRGDDDGDKLIGDAVRLFRRVNCEFVNPFSFVISIDVGEELVRFSIE